MRYPSGIARKPRIHYLGALYHAMLQANGGEDIFFKEADRRHFIGLIVARYFARHVATLSNEVGGPLKDQTKTNISEGMSLGSKSV